MADNDPVSEQILRVRLEMQKEFNTATEAVVTARIKALEELMDQRFIMSERSRDLALDANNKRLDGMNEFRQSLSDAAKMNITRTEVEAQFNAIREKFEQVLKPNWMMMVGVISLILTMITGVWLVIGLKIDTSTGPLDAKVAAMASSTENTRVLVGTLTERVNVLRNDGATTKATMAEIESQFCAGDIVRNLMHAQDMRLVSMLWRKQFPDSPYPTDNSYYPRVCNRVDPASK